MQKWAKDQLYVRTSEHTKKLLQKISEHRGASVVTCASDLLELTVNDEAAKLKIFPQLIEKRKPYAAR